jgi:hypothetical protein
VTEHISRLWTRNKNVGGQTVQVAEVQITSRTLENLEKVLSQCKARHEEAKRQFGADFEKRKNTLSEADRKTLSKLLGRLQLWPAEQKGQVNLKYFEEQVDLPARETPVKETAEKGFDGLGSLFG